MSHRDASPGPLSSPVSTCGRHGVSSVRPFVGPARVLAGAHASAQVGDELLTAGARPGDGAVVLVADRAVLDLGLADPARDSLTERGFAVEVAPGIAGEPTPADVIAALEGVRDRGVAAIVGIGGGSAMDVAKLAALAIDNDIDLGAGLRPDRSVRRRHLLVLVATTAGTGAEATSVAMLWEGGAKVIFAHARLVPDVAILDADLLRQLPDAVIAGGGMDAASHAIESLLSTFRTPLTAAAAGQALRGLARSLPEAFANRTSRSLNELLLSAFQAGLALNASVCLGHSIAYTIAARSGLPHGVTCAMALPYCLAYCHPQADEQIAAVAGLMGMPVDSTALLTWVTELSRSLEIPQSLSAVGISEAQLSSMAQECLETYPRPNSPVAVQRERLEALLVAFWQGDLEAAWRALPAAAGNQE